MENEQKQQEQEIDLIELFYKIIVHWRWFLIAIAVALCTHHHTGIPGFSLGSDQRF